MLTYSNDVLPKHIAIIMDGNGRWAARRFMPRIAGHRAGLQAAKKIAKYCVQIKINVLTLFAFSSENWRRPVQEVDFLMDLFLATLEREVHEFHDQQVRVRFVGERSRLNPKIVSKMNETEKLTQMNTGMVLIIAIDYGGQWDLYQATKTLVLKAERGELRAQALTYQDIESHLSFSDFPCPDLLIRTSGEKRISNFMLWQLAYSELYFTDILWPDFDEKALDQALADYTERERRFGYSSEQLVSKV